MRFTDSHPDGSGRYRIRRMDYILAGAGHILILLAGLISFTSSASAPSGGEDAMMISMVTLSAPETSVQDITPETTQIVVEEVEEIQEAVIPDIQEELQEAIVIEENPDEQVPDPVHEETTEEIQQEHPDEIQEEITPETSGDFVSVSSQGMVGAGAPGPGTYESRVFNAVRRGYRTSVVPERSYRIILTVNPDGTTEVEVVRTSGTSAFDRAVENALAIAQIPPMPPGRTGPVIINIEFLGPE